MLLSFVFKRVHSTHFSSLCSGLVIRRRAISVLVFIIVSWQKWLWELSPADYENCCHPEITMDVKNCWSVISKVLSPSSLKKTEINWQQNSYVQVLIHFNLILTTFTFFWLKKFIFELPHFILCEDECKGKGSPVL